MDHRRTYPFANHRGEDPDTDEDGSEDVDGKNVIYSFQRFWQTDIPSLLGLEEEMEEDYSDYDEGTFRIIALL